MQIRVRVIELLSINRFFLARISINICICFGILRLLSIELFTLLSEIVGKSLIQIVYDTEKQSNKCAAHVLGELEHEAESPQEVVPVNEQEDRSYHHHGEVCERWVYTPESLYLDEEVNQVENQAEDGW